MHRYYPRVYPKSCLLCNNPFDTASQVLNGCMIFNDMYIKRHDKTVNHIHSQLTTSRPQFTVYVNRLIAGNMLNEIYANAIHRKPDLLILQSTISWKRLTLLKFLRRTTLLLTNVITPNLCITVICVNASISTRLTRAKSSLLSLGPTGCVYKNVVPGLKILGFDTRRSKAIAKYLSISAAIGSKIVWQMRVGAVNAQC